MCPKNFPTRRHLHEHAKRKHPGSPQANAAAAAEEQAKKEREFVEQQQPQQQQQQPLPAMQPPAYPHQQQQQHPLPAFHYHHPGQHNFQPSSALPRLSCDLCPASFPDEATLETHVLSHFPAPLQPVATSVVSSAASSNAHPDFNSWAITGGSDPPMPLPPPVVQHHNPAATEDSNVGSLMRLVYNCSDQGNSSSSSSSSSNASQHHQQPIHQQDFQPLMSKMDNQHQDFIAPEYNFEGFLI